MLLELIHETAFEYSEPVSEAYMEFRLTPVSDSQQRVLQHRRRVTPHRTLSDYSDAYGNAVSYFNLMEPHTHVGVRFESVVETCQVPFRGEAVGRDALDSPAARVMLHDFLRPTPLTEWCQAFREFVPRFEGLRGKPVGEVADAVCQDLYRSFRYEGEVTSVQSPVSDILRHGGGVCQDFAHLMIATCRYLGYPTRYASGYVLPDDGQDATASHAWVELYDPDRGWFGIDPTHNQRVGERYIYLGVGRDFRDVPPNRGIFRGHALETMHVRVHLQPITPDDLGRRAREVYKQPRVVPTPPARQTRKPERMTLMEQVQTAQQQQQQQQQQ